MNRQSITGIVLIVLLTIGYFIYVGKEAAKRKPLQRPTGTTDTTKIPTPTPAAPDTGKEIAGVLPTLTLPEATPTGRMAAAVETVTVTTPLYIAQFENRGARLVNFELTQFHEADGTQVNLVPQENRPTLSLLFPYENFDLNQHFLVPSAKEIKIDEKSGAQVLTWILKQKKDSLLTLTYRFSPQTYAIDLQIKTYPSLAAGKEYRLGWLSGLSPTEKNRAEDLSHFGASARMGEDYVKVTKFSDHRLHEAATGETWWAATRSKYFGVALIPRSRPGAGFYTDGELTELELNGKKIPERRIAVELVMDVSPGKLVNDSFSVYLGPLDYKELRSFHLGLENMLDLGFKIIKPFSIAILWCFQAVHKIIPSYGIVIILFTLVIKVLTFPLSRKMIKSMQKMSALQPKMAALKERYKNDAKRMNAEMMKLYKEAGVNPLGGCLPMVLQLPLWWALFAVFRTTIQLRGTRFLWLPDLSQPDAFPSELFPLLPIVMALTMFWQQKLTTKDPKQKMLVYLMPIMFFFFFRSFPTGLVLYWTMFNILSVAEIYLTGRHKTPAPMTA